MIANQTSKCQYRKDSDYSESKECCSLVFHALEDDLKFEVKLEAPTKTQNDCSTDASSLFKSKGSLETISSLHEVHFQSDHFSDEQFSRLSSLRLSESLSIQTSKTFLSNDETRMELDEIAERTSVDECKEDKRSPTIQISDCVYERAEKFLDLKNLQIVIPGDEHRSKNYIRVFSKSHSLKDEDFKLASSPLLASVNTSSLIARRENSPEFKGRKSVPHFSITLQKLTSQSLNSSPSKGQGAKRDSNEKEFKEIFHEEEDNSFTGAWTNSQNNKTTSEAQYFEQETPSKHHFKTSFSMTIIPAHDKELDDSPQ